MPTGASGWSSFAAPSPDQLVAGSRVDLVRSGVAIAVRSGAAGPAIATEDDVKHAVQSAASISYSTGPSGVALAKLFERWVLRKRS